MGQESSDLAVAQAVADPLRLRILQRLMDGPATVSDLVSSTGESQSKVSNHLAILRERELVESERRGRRAIYRLRSPSVAVLIEALAALSRSRDASKPTQAIASARTCYDHVAGKLGVELLESLVAAGAVRAQGGDSTDLGLGPNGERLFARLGVDLEALSRTKRRFAFACDDLLRGIGQKLDIDQLGFNAINYLLQVLNLGGQSLNFSININSTSKRHIN